MKKTRYGSLIYPIAEACIGLFNEFSVEQPAGHILRAITICVDYSTDYSSQMQPNEDQQRIEGVDREYRYRREETFRRKFVPLAEQFNFSVAITHVETPSNSDGPTFCTLVFMNRRVPL